MGSRGPVPKRSDQRVRRNKDEGEVEKVTAIGATDAPPLNIENCHPMIQDFYDSLQDSAQSQYYEPSDWEFARFTLHFANQLVWSGKPSAQMFAGITAALSDLLVSEGARRRVKLEVEREQAKGDLIDVAEMFRERFKQN